MKHDDSRSLMQKMQESYKSMGKEILAGREAISLIAFVQKHKLDVVCYVWPNEKDVWGIEYTIMKNDKIIDVKRFEGKTWAAAVRKAKRVIEGRKK